MESTSALLSDSTRELLADRANRSSLPATPSDVSDVTSPLGTALELPVLRRVDRQEEGSTSGCGREGS